MPATNEYSHPDFAPIDRNTPDHSYVAPIDAIVGAITNERVTWAVGRSEITYNLSGLGGVAVRENIAQGAFNAWSDVINVTFREARPGEQADINFAISTGFFAYPVNMYTGEPAKIEVPVLRDTSYIPVGNAMLSLMHEIGHVLGFSHPVIYKSGATYEDSFANDTRQFSIFSYFEQANFGGATSLPPTTLQMADMIAAIERYGASNARAGDDVYGFNVTPDIAGGVYDFAYYADSRTNPVQYKPGFTIFDTDGIDTLDVSGFAHDQRIDLNDETWSDIGGYINNVAIARGTMIENAIGGAGNDTITGNRMSNVMIGGNGDDHLIGEKGNDTLYGGAGNDILSGGKGMDSLWGGEGRDRFVFDTSPDQLVNVDFIRDYSSGVDRIHDFTSGEDIIELHREHFSGIDLTGILSNENFEINITGIASDEDIRIIYDQSNGHLLYDADGIGTEHLPAHFASLTGTPEISAADFYVV